jgi:chitodextrinase
MESPKPIIYDWSEKHANKAQLKKELEHINRKSKYNYLKYDNESNDDSWLDVSIGDF